MARLETLHSRQANVETPQKCQLTAAGRVRLLSCCRNSLLSWSAGAQLTDFSGECSRAAKEAPKLCSGQHGLPSSDGDAPQGLVPNASWGKQPWRMGGSSWRRMLLPGLEPQGVPVASPWSQGRAGLACRSSVVGKTLSCPMKELQGK